MIYGDSVAEKVCVRCKESIVGQELVFKYGTWYHKLCWEEGERELQRANTIMMRFGFDPLMFEELVKVKGEYV